MTRITPYLLQGRERGGSDVHVSAGLPPMMRLDGELIALDPRRLSEGEVDLLVAEVLPPELRKRLDERGAADFSHQEPEAGRFRMNVCRQRLGFTLVARLIPDRIPNLDDLGLPPIVAQLAALHSGLVLVTGGAGHRQVHHAGRVGGSLEPDAQPHHRFPRRADRVRAREPHVVGGAARGGARRAHLSRGTARGASAGSRRDRGGGDARPRDDLAGHRSRRDRALGLRHPQHPQRASDRASRPRRVPHRIPEPDAAHPGREPARRGRRRT